MSVTIPDRPGLTMAGYPMSSPLRDVWGLSRQIVGHFVKNVVPCAALPDEAIYGDITTTTLPIDTVHHAIHDGFKIGLDMVTGTVARCHDGAGEASAALDGTAASQAALSLGATDFQSLVDGAKRVIEILETMTCAVSMAYVREQRAVVSEHHTAVHTLTSALLGGHPTSTMAASAVSRSPSGIAFWRWRFRHIPSSPIRCWTRRWWPAASFGGCRPNWRCAAAIHRCRCCPWMGARC
jgi:hypothetical protein